jgi:hypothetical protein
MRRHCYENGAVTVWLGGDTDAVKIRFRYVRAALHYKESELYERIHDYGGDTIFDGGEPSIGVFRLSRGVLLSLSPTRLIDEEPSVYWVSTADECPEILGFEDPSIDILQGESA